jgi:type IV pilus assembly protein PilC
MRLPRTAPSQSGASRGAESRLDGRRRRGTVVAPNAAAARATLRRHNIVVLALVERGKAARPKATGREVTAFTRQLASLLRAGLPLAQALELISQAPAPSGIACIADALARGIADGTRFATALAHFPAQFDALYCQLVAVGEASGSLAAMLTGLADERERAAAMRAKVRGACLSRCRAALRRRDHRRIARLGRTGVSASVRKLRRSPGPTRAVIALSDAAAQAGGPVLALVGALHVIAARIVRRSHGARLAWHRIALAAPFAGPVCAALAAARFYRALGTLLAAGTPLADALGSLTRATDNTVFDRASVDIAGRLARGERLAAAMRAARCFPASIVQPIAIAEESGALDAMLLDVATLAEREANEKLALFASLAEPLVVIVLGTLIGGLVVALYLPVIELGNVV